MDHGLKSWLLYTIYITIKCNNNNNGYLFVLIHKKLKVFTIKIAKFHIHKVRNG